MENNEIIHHLSKSENIEQTYDELHHIIVKLLAYRYGIPPEKIQKILKYCAKKNKKKTEIYLNTDFREKVKQLNEKNKKPNLCASCGTDENLTLHHIKPQSRYPELRYKPENIEILCENCHKELHNTIPINVPEITSNPDDIFRLRRLNIDSDSNKKELMKEYKIILPESQYKKVISDRQIQKTYTEKQKMNNGEIVKVAFVDEDYNIEEEEKVIISKCISKKFKDINYADAKSEGYKNTEEFKNALKEENKKIKSKHTIYMYVFSHIKQGI